MENDQKIAVIIPCFNEEITIGKVICDFKRELPNADIIVIDNNSTDNSIQYAAKAGALVIKENQQGKGYAVKRAVNDVKADLYVLVDGDDTYHATDVHAMLNCCSNGIGMVVGNRLTDENKALFRGHRKIGNYMINFVIKLFFKSKYYDVLSGYRILTRPFVESISFEKGGFEVETELFIKALKSPYGIQEIPIRYNKRPEGSLSKLSALSDGLKIILTIVSLR